MRTAHGPAAALLTLAVVLAAPAAHAMTLSGSCLMLAKNPQGTIEAVANTSQVDAAISASPIKALLPPDGYSGASILCTRRDFLPGGHDYRVLQLGMSLLIKSTSHGVTRSGALELVNGTVQFRLYPGTTLDPSEVDRLKAAIDALQAAYDSSPDSPKTKK